MKLQSTHPSLQEARTVFTSQVKPVSTKVSLLKSCKSNNKIGKGSKYIEKGDWKGMPIYTLTLEERKTCPTYCNHWKTCYGNNMFLAHRYKHGAVLQSKLDNELGILSKKYPKGFVIRLHILGDFYSVKYVNFWERMFAKYKALHVFGYTGRDPYLDPIGKSIRHKLNRTRGNRCLIRFSQNEENDGDIYFAGQYGEIHIPSELPCPEQSNKTKSCLTCGLCWNKNVTKTITFKTH